MRFGYPNISEDMDPPSQGAGTSLALEGSVSDTMVDPGGGSETEYAARVISSPSRDNSSERTATENEQQMEGDPDNSTPIDQGPYPAFPLNRASNIASTPTQAPDKTPDPPQNPNTTSAPSQASKWRFGQYNIIIFSFNSMCIGGVSGVGLLILLLLLAAFLWSNPWLPGAIFRPLWWSLSAAWWMTSSIWSLAFPANTSVGPLQSAQSGIFSQGPFTRIGHDVFAMSNELAAEPPFIPWDINVAHEPDHSGDDSTEWTAAAVQVIITEAAELATFLTELERLDSETHDPKMWLETLLQADCLASIVRWHIHHTAWKYNEDRGIMADPRIDPLADMKEDKIGIALMKLRSVLKTDLQNEISKSKEDAMRRARFEAGAGNLVISIDCPVELATTAELLQYLKKKVCQSPLWRDVVTCLERDGP